jgi:hypothetical protein
LSSQIPPSPQQRTDRLSRLLDTSQSTNTQQQGQPLIIRAETEAHPDDRATKNRIKEATATFERRKEAAIIALTSVAVAAVGGIAAWFLFSSSSTLAQQGWAQSVLSAIVGGIVGYKLTKPKDA